RPRPAALGTSAGVPSLGGGADRGGAHDRPGAAVTRTLIVTNDFPPRPGGIQAFVHNLAVHQPPGSVVVYASTWRGAAAFDARQPFEVVREDTRVLLPTPKVGRRAVELARAYGCDAVLFGAAAPLGVLGERLRREAGVRRVVALTHGHEVGWAALPGARSVLRRIGRGADVVTYLGEYTRVRLARVLDGVTELRRLTPGVDLAAFRPDVDGDAVRRRYGVGGGPDGKRVARLAGRCGVADHVVFTGTVPREELPAHYAAGNVYAMPCRTRLGGLDVEGLGIVYLEASACGLPVVAGRSGGAPDAVRDGETGYVVDGRDLAELTDRLVTLLADPALAAKLGAAGRAWVEAQWRWESQAAVLRDLLAPGGDAGTG